MTVTIKNNAVNYSKIQDVGAKKLLGNSGENTGLVGEIGLSSVFDLSGGTISLASKGIETSHLADGSVTTDAIGDGQITDAKIVSVSDTKLEGTMKVVSGNLGIGTTNPSVKVDVDGVVRAQTIAAANGLRIGSSTMVCDASTEGTLRYNAVIGNFLFCDGQVWRAAGGKSSSALRVTFRFQAMLNMARVTSVSRSMR